MDIKKGNLITWPGIYQLAFHKTLDTTIAMELGRMNQERKKIRLTKNKQLQNHSNIHMPKDTERFQKAQKSAVNKQVHFPMYPQGDINT